ncbi:MAG: hypothetical protein RLY31_598 [Bacteroidota bacterium]|jgi:hypothetical protein
MKILSYVVCGLLLLLQGAAHAQLEKTIHQTFETGTAGEVRLDLYGEYEVIAWAGNFIMTETKIEIFNATSYIFNYLIDRQNRYLVESSQSDGIFHLYSHDKKREVIRTKSGDCEEKIIMKVFIPEKFISNGSLTYLKHNN